MKFYSDRIVFRDVWSDVEEVSEDETKVVIERDLYALRSAKISKMEAVLILAGLSFNRDDLGLLYTL